MQTPGRPRKARLERRDTPVTVRFKLDEAAQLDLFASEAGMTTSEFLRMRALADKPRSGIAPDLKHDLYQLLLAIQRGLRDDLPPPVLADRMQAVIDRLQQ